MVRLFAVLAARLHCLRHGHTLRFMRALTNNEQRLFGATMAYRCATCPALIYNNVLPAHMRGTQKPLTPVETMEIDPDVPVLTDTESGPTVA